MCLAIPGKIIEIQDKTAIVKYPAEKREVLLDPNIPVKVGDYVLVQMKMIIQTISEKQALEAQRAWSKTM